MGYIEGLRKLVGTRPLILVGAVVIVINQKGELLLEQRQFPKGVWGLPGGLMELGESTEDVAKREVLEETNLQVEDLSLINIYSGSDYFTKAQNGDEFYSVTAAYFTHNYSGKVKHDEKESMDIQFFAPGELPEQMIGSHREIIEDYKKKFL
ncbi:NUDIX domain-containing protein [Filobacillus milosensis]|uniref:NUDIX domain-containing protein n=1 Tax=Filobacillus milosensis TaxID=94137 RepID=A0A4Y8IQ39_9BACI|nr:NUDIX hydrolase [Filobacillus milosensis]TFB22813.1 NUDIX domain-containing protein [Filobacillus milosensis]